MLHELTPRLASLEEAYMELTADSSEYGVGAAQVAPPADGTEPASTEPAGTEPAAQRAIRHRVINHGVIDHGAGQPMTTTSPAAPAAAPIAVPPATHHVGFGHLMLAEWTKIRSVRSTVWTLLLFVLITSASPRCSPG